MTTIKEFIQDWEKSEKKQNNPIFIRLFTEFLNKINENPDGYEIVYHGDGSYFGKCLILQEWSFFNDSLNSFEIAYCDTIFSVYTPKHQGFWVPEYIKLKKGDK